MILGIASKLVAESLLSLYPTFVKNINLAIGLQLWSRCFAYIIISGLFIDWSFIWKHLFGYNGLLLSCITTIHIYTSYRGFQLLDGGIAYALFYTYPLMILLLSEDKIHYSTIFALSLTMLGVIIIYFSDMIGETIGSVIGQVLGQTIDQVTSQSTKPSNKSNNNTNNNSDSQTSNLWGYIMIFFAALTEAIIYFLVREIKTLNNWNHLFISYLFGAIASTIYFFQDIIQIRATSNLSISLFINICIGLFGYLLRFYAASRLKPSLYAPLSYFGIVMAFIYGIIFNGEFVSIVKLMGVLCIILGVYSTIGLS